MAIFSNPFKNPNTLGGKLFGALKNTIRPVANPGGVINPPRASAAPLSSVPIGPQKPAVQPMQTVNRPAAPQPVAMTAAPQPQMPSLSPEEQSKFLQHALNLPPPGQQLQSQLAAQPQVAPQPTPQPIAPPLIDTTAFDTAQKNYLGNLQMSPEEEQTQTQLNDLVSKTNMSITGLEGQGRGIPMPLIRGQQGQLAQQSQLQQQTLQQKLALAQAKRQSAMDVSKASLAIEQDKLKTLQDQRKPLEVGGNLIRLNPTTGKYETVFSNPDEAKPIELNGQLVTRQADGSYKSVFGSPKASEGFTLGEGQKRYDASGNLVASGPDKSTTVKQNLVKVNGKDYLVDENGNLTEPQIPASTAATSELKNKALTSAKALLDKFTASGGSTAVGKSRLFGLQRIPGTGTRDFENDFNTLKSLLSLDNVSLLKGQGAVSDAERQLLADASTRLNLAQSEGEFQKALQEIVQALSGTGGGQQIIEYQGKRYQLDPSGNFDPSRPLTSVGGDTNKASTSIKLGSPLARANNNPGNLRYVGQAGAVQGQGGFAKFSTPQAGVEALKNQIKLDASRGHTLASFISKYAPPSENNTDLYVKQISQRLGVNPQTNISKLDINQLVREIAKKESSSIIV